MREIEQRHMTRLTGQFILGRCCSSGKSTTLRRKRTQRLHAKGQTKVGRLTFFPLTLCLIWRCRILSRLVVYSTSRQWGWGSLWLVLMLVSDFSIIWEEVMSPWRLYSSRDFVEYIIKFLPPFFPLLRANIYVSYSLVLSVDIQRTSALIEVMFWSQIVLIRRGSRTQLLLHLGRRNWLENWWY